MVSIHNFFVQAIEAYIYYHLFLSFGYVMYYFSNLFAQINALAMLLHTSFSKSLYLFIKISSKNYLRIKSYTPYFHCASQSTTIIRYLLDEFSIECAPNGIGLIVAGRIKGHMKTRFVNALSLRSFTNRIIDIGIISSVSTLGLVAIYFCVQLIKAEIPQPRLYSQLY